MASNSMLDDAALKKKLKAGVKNLASMVDADWHDGWEEQGEEVIRYVKDLEPHLRAVVEVCTDVKTPSRAALVPCNLVLVEIADSWRDMGMVPFRCSHEEVLSDSETRLDLGGFDDIALPDGDELSALSRKRAVSAAWCTLLRVASSSEDTCDDETLLRFVKDALDFGVMEEDILQAPEGGDEATTWHTAGGVARLEAAVKNRAGRDALPTRLTALKHYRAIDRRFDGPKHRRTRDFGDAGWW